MTQRVMHDLVTVLNLSRWIANDVQYGHVFAERTSDATERRQLAGAVCRHKCTNAVADSGVAICGIGSIELVGIAFPFETSFGDKIE